MKSTSLMALIGLLAVSPAIRAADATAAIATGKPNILFVFADQWRAQAFGFAGDQNVQTPHLDALQRESIHFSNAVSGVPVCGPARASFQTGLRPLTHGVFMNDVPLDPNAVTIAKILRQEGYDTGYIGKWHINANGRSNFIPRERRQGFDYWKVLECSHTYNNSFYYADGPEKLKWEGYDAIAQTKDAQQYLRDHAAAEKPFVLYLSWGPPHDPYNSAPAKYRAMYQPAGFTLRPNVPAAVGAQVRTSLAGYCAHCTALDDCMGELLQTLRETGLAENTIVVFTADHGDLLGSHGGDNKQQPYDESIRVPLLVRWPAGLGAASRTVDTVINSEDLMPTLLGLSKVAVPRTVEGLDFSGYLRGGANPSDGATLISSPAPFGQWSFPRGGREFRGIRTQRYTYVRDLHGPWLLFDNQTDPYQLINLANQFATAKLQADMEAILTRKLKESSDEFLPAAAYIKKWGYTVDATGTVPYTN